MRFKMTFRIDRSQGDCLPINYQYEQSAVIYKILSNADKAYSGSVEKRWGNFLS